MSWDDRMKNANLDRPRGETDVRMSVKKIHCTPEVAAEIRADYSGNCTLIDDQIGRIFDVIRARGECSWRHAHGVPG